MSATDDEFDRLIRGLRATCTATKHNVECGQDASFVMQCLHCGVAHIFCAEHITYVRAHAKESTKVGCTTCRRYRQDLYELVSITPLRVTL